MDKNPFSDNSFEAIVKRQGLNQNQEFRKRSAMWGRLMDDNQILINEVLKLRAELVAKG